MSKLSYFFHACKISFCRDKTPHIPLPPPPESVRVSHNVKPKSVLESELHGHPSALGHLGKARRKGWSGVGCQASSTGAVPIVFHWENPMSICDIKVWHPLEKWDTQPEGGRSCCPMWCQEVAQGGGGTFGNCPATVWTRIWLFASLCFSVLSQELTCWARCPPRFSL